MPRAQILDAATEVFGERGLQGATIRDLGRAAGVNSALLYYYFEDKESLFAECVDRVLREFFRSLETRPHPPAGAEARLRLLVDGVLDYFTRFPARTRLIGLALTLHGELLGRTVAHLLRDGLPLPLRVLQEGMERGELRRLNPVQTWWCLLGACLGSLQMAAAVRRGGRRLPVRLPTPEEQREQIVDTFLRGLDARPRRRPPRETNA